MRAITPDDLLAIQLPGDPQLSPDGRRLAYVVARIDKESNEYRHQIHVMNAEPGARPAPFTGGQKSDKSPRWSPDGSRLAFTSNRSEKTQVWVMDAFGGEARQLTFFKEGVSGVPVWSPDGTHIAVTAVVGPEGPGREGDKDAESDLYKKYTRGVRRITRIFYKEDGEGFLEPDRHQQIFVLPVEGERPEPVQVTKGPWHHEDPAWAPDGGALAYVANRREDDDYTVMLADLWVQDLSNLASDPVCLTPGTMSLGTPAWSPDGAAIAFSGQQHEPYRGYSSNQLWLVNRDGSGLRRLVPGWDRNVGPRGLTDMPAPSSHPLRWTPDGTVVILLGSDCGRQQLFAVDVESDTLSQLTAGDHTIYSWSTDAQCQKICVGLTRPDVPGDLFLAEGPDLLPLTHTNRDLLSDIELAPVEHYRFAAGESEADGWVMKPVGFDPSRRYPAVLEIHGGPMAMYSWAFMMEFQCLAAAGYAVIYTNPRGSQGYGQQFCACIKEDWGNLDYLDVMAGLEAALARCPWIDPDRLGIAGGSYGGFMTNWTLGQTDRFKAAVTMRSVVNEASSVGTSDYGFVDLMNYPAKPWEDMTFYRRVSPLTHVEKIRTPLLIEHQEQDYRCPMEQAEQLYTALKYLRRTVEFVRYPDSSHGMSRTGKPWLRVHRLRTILEWFAKYIPAQ
ncbi:MAG TPA: S9 family peptidase [Symbiobacteriaceae bacterium]|nr:S9 family peptidase [Symbiobacteriaceae bacterium]